MDVERKTEEFRDSANDNGNQRKAIRVRLTVAVPKAVRPVCVCVNKG